MKMKGVILFLCLALVFWNTEAVDRSRFKKCSQANFCKRNREMAERENPSYSIPSPLSLKGNKLTGPISIPYSKSPLFIEFSAIDEILRMRIYENHPKRYFGPTAEVLQTLKETTISIDKTESDRMVFSFGTNSHGVLHFSPFRLEVYQDDVLIISTNNRNLFNFENIVESKEHDRLPSQVKSTATRPETWNDELDGIWEAPLVSNPDLDGRWEETFNGHPDSKPNGPTAVAIDFTFEQSQNVYGIPEHAASFSLKPTRGRYNEIISDPYRLYNLDVFEYETRNEMALYGSIPFMVSHSKEKTTGIFWLNSAEMWVDVHEPVEESTGDFRTHTHWIAESGIIDVFFLTGPTPKNVYTQYATLTGTTALPPAFALGYHQCKWNYRDEAEVKEVEDGFEKTNTPLDVIWLDIEHTDGKKYFTWDKHNFPTPKNMLQNMANHGRKMVTIVDPHIKRDGAYEIHTGAQYEDLYVKKQDGNEYEGHCWPGSSSWIDFLNPKAREWWAKRFDYNIYQGSTPNLFTWNDMNEPSVFSGPEITMHKDAKHYGNLEHREIHNIYGMLQHRSTFEGQIQRNQNHNERPFVLTRSFFAGSQRYGALWTGDNTAKWDHLAVAQPMLLTLSVAGFPFAGSDIGGFFGNPEEELLSRWFQAAVFHPFFREHGHIDTKRREPFLYQEPWFGYMRNAIRMRYTLLPYYYTLFYESHKTGSMVLTPLWVQFPEEEEFFAEEQMFLLGNGLLVRPISKPISEESSLEISLPGKGLWYDFYTKEKISASKISIQLKLDNIPIFYRGGSIVPTQERLRRSTSQMTSDPYTLTIALDKESKAKGTLFVDDGHSFNYQKGDFVYTNLQFENFELTNEGKSSFQVTNTVEKIRILGLNSIPKSVVLLEGGKSVDLEGYLENPYSFVIRNPNVNVGNSWKIKLNF